MQITAPFGYGEIVPLEKNHKVLLPGMGAGGGNSTPSFCRKLNAMALSFSEIIIASRDYPIVFSTADNGQSFAPLAVLGLGNEQNLFINAGGEWNADTYVPAFVRRYPFCISKVYVDGAPQTDKVVCIDKTYLDDTGIALFDQAGQATAQWALREKLPAKYWMEYNAILVTWGQNVCRPISPLCSTCPINTICRKEGVGISR